jgi:hypothetical protein
MAVSSPFLTLSEQLTQVRLGIMVVKPAMDVVAVVLHIWYVSSVVSSTNALHSLSARHFSAHSVSM